MGPKTGSTSCRFTFNPHQPVTFTAYCGAMSEPYPELQPSQRPAPRRRDVRAAFVALAITGVAMYQLSGWLNFDRPEEFGPSYAGCSAARSAGVAPLLRGQAGYRANLDPDGDGVACDTPRS